MPLARLNSPFDHEDWVFEPKLDGFRALGYIEDGQCRLVSHNRNAFKTFPVLAEGIASAIPHEAVIDGEIVYLGPDGLPRFYDLMRRRSPQHFYAFDLLWLDGRDLRSLPLLKRKAMLWKLVRPPVLYVDHVVARGVDLFRAVCEQDLEGIVAKLSSGRYEPEATSWVKIKNPVYSQGEGRVDLFFRKPPTSATSSVSTGDRIHRQ
jgi:bifunctional non-homologous end joining protein LigD